jgi:hypothetical protein
MTLVSSCYPRAGYIETNSNKAQRSLLKQSVADFLQSTKGSVLVYV